MKRINPFKGLKPDAVFLILSYASSGIFEASKSASEYSASVFGISKMLSDTSSDVSETTKSLSEISAKVFEAIKSVSEASASVFETSKSVSNVSNGVAETIYCFYTKKARCDHIIFAIQPIPFLKSSLIKIQFYGKFKS